MTLKKNQVQIYNNKTSQNQDKIYNNKTSQKMTVFTSFLAIIHIFLYKNLYSTSQIPNSLIC